MKTIVLPGPIIDASRTFPTAVTSNSVRFSWQLAPESIIPITGFRVASMEEGNPLSFPTNLSPSITSFVFLNLTEGVKVTYQVRALSTDFNDGESPIVEFDWVTGRSLGKFYTHLNNIATGVWLQQLYFRPPCIPTSLSVFMLSLFH